MHLSSQSAKIKRMEPVGFWISAVHVRHSLGCSWVPSNAMDTIWESGGAILFLRCSHPLRTQNYDGSEARSSELPEMLESSSSSSLWTRDPGILFFSTCRTADWRCGLVVALPLHSSTSQSLLKDGNPVILPALLTNV